MWINEAMDEIKNARDKADTEGNYKARDTFDSILRVMSISNAAVCKKWSEHVEIIISKVLGGCYVGTNDEARKILNRCCR